VAYYVQRLLTVLLKDIQLELSEICYQDFILLL